MMVTCQDNMSPDRYLNLGHEAGMLTDHSIGMFDCVFDTVFLLCIFCALFYVSGSFIAVR
jgi:hypothetical protein